METMSVDSVLESPGAWRFAEESATTANGVGYGERLAMTVADVMEMLGATARAAKSSEAGVRAASAMPEPEAQRSVASKEQALRPEMSQGVVGHCMQPPSP